MSSAEARKGEVERIAFLLSHDLRTNLIREYAGRSACPTELASSLGRSLNLVSYHTNVLFDNGEGLLEVTGRKQVRGARATFFRLKPWGERTSLGVGDQSLGEVARLVQLELLIEVVAAGPSRLAEMYTTHGITTLGEEEYARLRERTLPEVWEDAASESGGPRQPYAFGLTLLPIPPRDHE